MDNQKNQEPSISSQTLDLREDLETKRPINNFRLLMLVLVIIIILGVGGVVLSTSNNQKIENNLNSSLTASPTSVLVDVTQNPLSQRKIEDKISEPAEGLVTSGYDDSYIVFSIDKDVNIRVIDAAGKEVGDSYIELPVADATKQDSTVVPEPKLRIFEYAKPQSGKYRVELSSASSINFQLDATFITQDAENKAETIKGAVSPGANYILDLVYDKQSLERTFLRQD